MPTGKVLGFLLFGLMAGQMYALDGAMDADKKAEQAEERHKAQLAQEEAAKALAAEFASKRSQILADIDQLVNTKKFADADALLSKYRSVGGNDIKTASKVLALAKAKDALRHEQTLTLEEKIDAYKVVKESEPDNKTVSASLDRLNQQLAKKQADEKEQRDKDEAFAKRKAAIEAQFSSWDGSHPSVEKMVKRGMKNPDSYQHVETKYAIKPNGFVVVTTIRGTNSFGGIVPQTFRAVLDDSGNVLSLTSAD